MNNSRPPKLGEIIKDNWMKSSNQTGNIQHQALVAGLAEQESPSSSC
jgi:hypothetical protein